MICRIRNNNALRLRYKTVCHPMFVWFFMFKLLIIRK